MNIVYLIGNGFDLKLGLKTSYKDFYQWYEKLPHDKQDPIILSFIKHCREKEKVDKDWSDMELALGKYTTEFKSESKIDTAASFHNSLVFAISDFIKSQESQIPVIDNAEGLLCNYLLRPEAGDRLLPKEHRLLKEYRNQWKNANPWSAYVISFNYTKTLEQLLNYKGPKNIGTYIPNGNGQIFLKEIEHVHGYTDNRLILGVHDESQIENESLHSDKVMNRYIKSKYNDLCGEEHHIKCQGWINRANLICIFGFSLGLTDKQWWEQIANKMLSDDNCRLLLFCYDSDNVFSDLQIIGREEHKAVCRDTFLNRAGVALTDSQKKSIVNRIYISYNSNMFSFNTKTA